MKRCANLFAIIALAATTMAATGCAAEADEETGDTSEALSTVALGVDTNGATLDINTLRGHGYSFVARYLSFDGSHPALTRDEANHFRAANVPLVAIWEVGQQRAVQSGSIKGQFAAGAADAHQANQRLTAVGATGKPIYFTVDFNVTPQYWAAKVRDSQSHAQIERGQLILAYFNGINSVIGTHRTGAYGTHTTIKELFDGNKIGFGWQQTFASRGDKIDPRAQLRQYDIYPSQTGWGVAGAGALDLDRAVKPGFGQW
jgi:Domain of unknown function (DUF1906)